MNQNWLNCLHTLCKLRLEISWNFLLVARSARFWGFLDSKVKKYSWRQNHTIVSATFFSRKNKWLIYFMHLQHRCKHVSRYISHFRTSQIQRFYRFTVTRDVVSQYHLLIGRHLLDLDMLSNCHVNSPPATQNLFFSQMDDFNTVRLLNEGRLRQRRYLEPVDISVVEGARSSSKMVERRQRIINKNAFYPSTARHTCRYGESCFRVSLFW